MGVTHGRPTRRPGRAAASTKPPPPRVTVLLALLALIATLSAYVLLDRLPAEALDARATIALHSDNGSSWGVWSDGTTVWVSDTADDKLYAYTLSTGARDADNDFNTLSAAGNDSPHGIWSDGTTMFVTDSDDHKLYAYKMSDKSNDSSKEFNLHSDNSVARGMWSDGTTIWVANNATANSANDKVFAYTLADGMRDSSEEFATLNAAGNNNVTGIWSDGTTMWVGDNDDDKVYAYKMSDQSRDPIRDFDLDSGHANGTGVGGYGGKLYSADVIDDVIYVYERPKVVWEATLTAKAHDMNTGDFGFGSDYATGNALSDDDFTRGSATFDVEQLSLASNTLTLELDSALSSDLQQGLSLYVGGTEFDFGDATTSDNTTFTFSASSLTWNASTVVTVGLKLVNTAATGAPMIAGAPYVGTELTAHTLSIEDPNGVPDAADSYQWIRVDGNNETDISGATSATYTPVADDLGKTLKVRVEVTDEDGFDEGSFTSAATVEILSENAGRGIWSAVMRVGAISNTIDGWRGVGTNAAGHLTDATFFYDGQAYRPEQISVTSASTPTGAFGMLFPTAGAGDIANQTTRDKLILHLGLQEFRLGDSTLETNSGVSAVSWNNAGLDWSSTTYLPLSIAVLNTEPTGAPAVDGDPTLGQALSVDTSGLTDANGVPTDAQSFTYQWRREEEHGPLTTVLDADLTVGAHSSGTLGYSLNSYGALSPSTFTHGGRTYTIEGIIVEFGFLELILTSSQTMSAAAAEHLVLIVDGEEFRLSAPFEGQEQNAGRLFSYSAAFSWSENDAIEVKIVHQVKATIDEDIPGATAPNYYPSDADLDKTLSVVVTGFTDGDDFENEGSFASVATEPVAGLGPTRSVPWSATITVGTDVDDGTGYMSNVWATNDPFGSASPARFTRRVTNHGVEALAYDSVLAKPLYMIIDRIFTEPFTLLYDGSGEVASVDATKSSDPPNAESYFWTASDPGWAVGDRVAAALLFKVNVEAEGFVVSGAPYVGNTLTAHRGAIIDPNGKPGTDSDYTYQWYRVDSSDNETEITGETSATYTLTDDDLGQMVKARISYTDDDGFEEELDSPVTAAIGAANVAKGIWSAVLTVGVWSNILGAQYGWDTGGNHVGGALSDTDLDYDGDNYELTSVSQVNEQLTLGFRLGDLANQTTREKLGLQIGNQLFNLGNGAYFTHSGGAEILLVPGVDWSMVSRVPLSIVVINSPAQGVPEVTGTFGVGEELTAVVSGITDANGLPAESTYAYQWSRVDCTNPSHDGDVPAETAKLFELSATDLTCQMVVTVSFTDLDGFSESVESIPLDLSLATWALTVSKSSVTEGGTDTVTATLSITNSHRYDVPITVDLWHGLAKLPHSSRRLKEENDGAVTITIAAGANSGSVVLKAVDETGEQLYFPVTRSLRALVGSTELDSVDLSIAENEPRPQVKLSVEPSTVTEGESFQVIATIEPRYLSDRFQLALEIVSGGAVLDNPRLTTTLAVAQRTETFTFQTTNDTVDADHPPVVIRVASVGSPAQIGSPSRVTVIVSDDDGPPGAPGRLSAEAGDGRVDLSWAAASSPSSPVTHYSYRYRLSTTQTWDPDWTQIPNSSASTRSFTVFGLQNGVDYIFEVRATNATGDGDAATITTASFGPPGRPDLSLVSRGDSILAIWEVSEDNDGGFAPNLYQIRWTDSSRNSYELGRAEPTDRVHVIPGLEEYTTYYVRVRASNDGGQRWGGWQIRSIRNTPLPRMDNLTTSNPMPDRLTVNWWQIRDWDDERDIRIWATEYEVQYIPITTSHEYQMDWTSNNSERGKMVFTSWGTGANNSAYRDVTGLSCDTNYYFRVRAKIPSPRFAHRDGWTEWSPIWPRPSRYRGHITNGMPDDFSFHEPWKTGACPADKTPTNLQVDFQGSVANLSWVAPTSPGVSGYRIERGIFRGIAIAQTLESTRQIDTVSGRTNASYVDETLCANRAGQGIAVLYIVTSRGVSGGPFGVHTSFLDHRCPAAVQQAVLQTVEESTPQPQSAVAVLAEVPLDVAVEQRVEPSLTVAVENLPLAHGGSEFTLELRFSENVKLSYTKLRDQALSASGGTVTRAQRLDRPSNQRWRITVVPNGAGPVTVSLAATSDCTAASAICTSDGTKLSNALSLTIPGS